VFINGTVAHSEQYGYTVVAIQLNKQLISI
jgi:hypothetical protein